MPIRLVTPPTDYPVSLTEAMEQCSIDEPAAEPLLTRLIAVATARCENMMHRSIMPQTWEITLDAFPVGAIRLGRPPVTAIAAIEYVDPSGKLVEVDSQDYMLDPDLLPGWAVGAGDWPDTMTAADAVRVRFDCGWPDAESVPQEIRHWILMWIGAAYENRESTTVQTGGSQIDLNFADSLLDNWVVPNL